MRRQERGGDLDRYPQPLVDPDVMVRIGPAEAQLVEHWVEQIGLGSDQVDVDRREIPCRREDDGGASGDHDGGDTRLLYPVHDEPGRIGDAIRCVFGRLQRQRQRFLARSRHTPILADLGRSCQAPASRTRPQTVMCHGMSDAARRVRVSPQRDEAPAGAVLDGF
jgi:hypothetical protein